VLDKDTAVTIGGEVVVPGADDRTFTGDPQAEGIG